MLNLENFSGQIIEPSSPDYEQARTVMMGKGSPALVLRPKNPADVALAIQHARANSLPISVRSGGHSAAAFGTNDGGLVIDLALMNQVELIDEGSGLVRVGAGAKWGDVANHLKQYGLALSSGDTKSVGVGGLTLGGGIGWMVKKYGLAIDSLIGAEIATADRQLLSINEKDNPDLFWAIRGGGGNFGVVTSFEFQAHKVGKVFAGPIIYKPENIGQFLAAWRDYLRTADESLSIILNLMPTFAGNPPMILMLCCYAEDDEARANAAIEPLLKIGTVTQNGFTRKDYADVLEEAHPPQGIKAVVNNILVNEFSDGLIAAVEKAYARGSLFQIRNLGGAFGRVSPEATAFAHRKAETLILSPTFLQPTATTADVQAALQPWRTVEAFGDGAYVQFISEQTDKATVLTYPKATHQRLLEIKRKYDPDNIFYLNINIK
jgi:FAD/FMN-containing dehydrogenase